MTAVPDGEGRHEAGLPAWQYQDSRRGFLGKAAVGALALSGAGLMAGCGGKADVGGAAGTDTGAATSATKPPATPTGTLRVANIAEPNFIDPANALEVNEFAVVRSVYDGLTGWNAGYSDIAPALATSWESNADATEWTFTLRDGVTFQDGSPFDATAARASIEHYQGSTWELFYAGIDKVDDSDPRVVKITFKQPSPDLGRNMTFTKMISPKLLAAKGVAKKAVGTGAFRWGEWEKGKQVVLEASPDAWSKDGPHVQSLQLKTITDPTTQLNALKTNEVDLMMRVAPRQVRELTSSPGFRTISKSTWLELHCIFRTDQRPFDDVRVRQAFAYGVDRQALVKDVLLGQGTVADTPMPLGTYGRSPGRAYAYDPEKAKSLLKAAGYPGGISIAITTGGQQQSLLGQAMVAQLKAAGIKATFEVQEPGVMVADLTAKRPKHQVFIATYGWLNGGPFHFTTKLLVVHPQYKGAQLNALIDKVNTTPNGPRRLRLLADAQQLFMEELPHFPLYYATLTDATPTTVYGYDVPRDAYQPVFAPVYLGNK